MQTPVWTSEARRALLVRLMVVAGAFAAGLALQRVLTARLERIEELSHTDVLAARAQLARIFEVTAVAVFGLTGAISVSMLFACRRSLALLEFPPPGLWSWGRARTVTGPRARTLARVGLGLGATLLIASSAGGGLMWYMAAVLRACRAH